LRRILIVRMSALGDIVHALPVLAALRDARPDAEIDWIADRKYAGVLDLVDGLNRRIIGRPRLLRALRELRGRRYDVAVDLQGLLKSAAIARLCGARRVLGFETRALRERGAAWFYSETIPVAERAHIIEKNLSVLPLLGVQSSSVRFPFIIPPSPVAAQLEAEVASNETGFALINPGAAWPNKRWSPERYGEVARRMRERHGLRSYVLWGEGESALADLVVSHSANAATRAPKTTLGDLLAVSSRARLMISGDTGPIHLAAAVGTPLVGLYGPTWPERNGPWHPDDMVVSRAAQCACHHKRECQRGGMSDGIESRMCINDISVDEVMDAIDARLARAAAGQRR
jgi:heptosyltransferase I